MPYNCRASAPAAAERGSRQSEWGVSLELVPQRSKVWSMAAAERGSPQSEAPCASGCPHTFGEGWQGRAAAENRSWHRESHPALTEGLTVFRHELTAVHPQGWWTACGGNRHVRLARAMVFLVAAGQ